MILINKESANTVVLTLLEKTTLNSPVYLFKFTNDLTRSSVKFIAQNVSNYNYRYNQFVITETSGTNYLTSGIITLSPTGSWSYTIYEQESLTNLNENLTTGIVETGKVKVVGDDTTYDVYDNNPKIYIGYGKGS